MYTKASGQKYDISVNINSIYLTCIYISIYVYRKILNYCILYNTINCYTLNNACEYSLVAVLIVLEHITRYFHNTNDIVFDLRDKMRVG